jgi:hypothetical protein
MEEKKRKKVWMDVKPGPTRIAADCTYHITMPDIPYL